MKIVKISTRRLAHTTSEADMVDLKIQLDKFLDSYFPDDRGTQNNTKVEVFLDNGRTPKNELYNQFATIMREEGYAVKYLEGIDSEAVPYVVVKHQIEILRYFTMIMHWEEIGNGDMLVRPYVHREDSKSLVTI